MGISVRWHDDERTIICWTFDGRWDWETFVSAAEYATQLRDSAPYRQPVNVIINTSSASPIQTGTLMLMNTTPMELANPLNNDKVVFVGRKAFNQKMTSVMRRMNVSLGERIQYADTMAEAKYKIRQG